ncbi:MAG: restriction endonuclease subunit S [Myxococcota bacterium]|nr:restriction endonuclease subunit S [Myxococcota bacterium]
MNELPQGWALVPAAAVFEFVTSGSRGWAQYYSDVGALFIRIGNLDHSTISLDLTDRQHVRPPTNAEGARTRLQAGDILISITAELGMVGIVPRDLGEAYVNQHLALARPVSGLNAEYLAWFFAGDGKRQLLEMRRGMTKAGLGLDDVRRVSVLVAPLKEQRRIVTKLDAILEQSGAAKGRLERLPALLDRLKRSILAAAFRGDLTADWRNANPNVAGEWQEMTVEDCLAEPMANGRSVPDGTGSPVLRLTALRAGRVDLSARKLGNWTLAEAARFYVQRGDFLVARGNGSLDLVGRGGIVEDEPDGVAYPDTLIRLRMKPDLVAARYLRWAWESPAVRTQIETAAHTTAGIHKVSQGDLSAIRIQVPSIPEQLEVVKRLDAALASTAALIEVVRRVTERVNDLERSARAKAFRGELVAQDPADEPASALIERIRAVVDTRTENGAAKPRDRAARAKSLGRIALAETES